MIFNFLKGLFKDNPDWDLLLKLKQEVQTKNELSLEEYSDYLDALSSIRENLDKYNHNIQDDMIDEIQIILKRIDAITPDLIH